MSKFEIGDTVLCTNVFISNGVGCNYIKGFITSYSIPAYPYGGNKTIYEISLYDFGLVSEQNIIGVKLVITEKTRKEFILK